VQVAPAAAARQDEQDSNYFKRQARDRGGGPSQHFKWLPGGIPRRKLGKELKGKYRKKGTGTGGGSKSRRFLGVLQRGTSHHVSAGLHRVKSSKNARRIGQEKGNGAVPGSRVVREKLGRPAPTGAGRLQWGGGSVKKGRYQGDRIRQEKRTTKRHAKGRRGRRHGYPRRNECEASGGARCAPARRPKGGRLADDEGEPPSPPGQSSKSKA